MEVCGPWHLGNISSIKQGLNLSSVVRGRDPCSQGKDLVCWMEMQPKGMARVLRKVGQAASQLRRMPTHCRVSAE